MNIPSNVLDIINLLNTKHEAYIIGGACRDYHLGTPSTDFDVVTSATPEQVLELFPQAITAGNSFLVSLVDGIEVATYREDKAEEALPVKTLIEDMARRDFTVNAIAYYPADNVFLDGYNGVKDLGNRLLRFIGDPLKRIAEDPIRILRGVRLAAKHNLTIEKDTFFAMLECREALKTVPTERLQAEIIKAFKTTNTHRFLTMLDEMEIFGILFPSLYQLKGIDGGGYHNETVFTHSLGAVKAVEDKDWKLKLACLYHDSGKRFPIINDKGFNTFCEHNILGLDYIIADLSRHLKFSGDVVNYVKYLSLMHMNHVIGTRCIRRTYAQLCERNIPVKDFIYLRYADKRANVLYTTKFFEEWCVYRRFMEVINAKTPASVKMLKVNGTDVMEILSIPPSRIVGQVLETLFNLVINEAIENTREALIPAIKELRP